MKTIIYPMLLVSCLFTANTGTVLGANCLQPKSGNLVLAVNDSLTSVTSSRHEESAGYSKGRWYDALGITHPECFFIGLCILVITIGFGAVCPPTLIVLVPVTIIAFAEMWV